MKIIKVRMTFFDCLSYIDNEENKEAKTNKIEMNFFKDNQNQLQLNTKTVESRKDENMLNCSIKKDSKALNLKIKNNKLHFS